MESATDVRRAAIGERGTERNGAVEGAAVDRIALRPKIAAASQEAVYRLRIARGSAARAGCLPGTFPH